MEEPEQNSLFDLPPIEPPEITDKTVFHIGVSGGKDSTAVLLWMLHESGIDRSKLNVTFCDTGNEHEWTYQHIQMLSEKVFPIETLKPKLGFFDLAFQSKRFPSPVARFCTVDLKIIPTQRHITALMARGRRVIAVSGVRGDESLERSKLPEWDFNGNVLCIEWRPLIAWSLLDVMRIHKRHNIPLNPLYNVGARRVGCWPCIMSSKAEIRNIAQKFPERIAEIRAAEIRMANAGRQFSGFFGPEKIPQRFHTGRCLKKDGTEATFPTIDDVVRWSMSGKRAKGSFEDDPPEPEGCMSGYCE